MSFFEEKELIFFKGLIKKAIASFIFTFSSVVLTLDWSLALKPAALAGLAYFGIELYKFYGLTPMKKQVNYTFLI